jgi:hypothetical protein
VANTPDAPAHIYQLVSDLGRWITAATRPGLSDDQAFCYSQYEEAAQRQLAALGWDAVLNDEMGQWLPCPLAYTLVHNAPDPLYYPQRCYKVPEGPARWEHIWVEETRMSFPAFQEAYEFLFAYDAQRQELLPMKRYGVRSEVISTGAHYAARTAEQAARLHLNLCVESELLRVEEVVTHRVTVYEHRMGLDLYCEACRHAPCKAPMWPMPTAPGRLA